MAAPLEILILNHADGSAAGNGYGFGGGAPGQRLPNAVDYSTSQMQEASGIHNPTLSTYNAIQSVRLLGNQLKASYETSRSTYGDRTGNYMRQADYDRQIEGFNNLVNKTGNLINLAQMAANGNYAGAAFYATTMVVNEFRTLNEARKKRNREWLQDELNSNFASSQLGLVIRNGNR